jgi:hypothetical protein
MKVSKQFLRDFAYIANLYGWNAEDVEDAKAQTRANRGELVPYWARLAAAHRAGYQQTVDNNYMRLGHWLQLQNDGSPSPGVATSEEGRGYE